MRAISAVILACAIGTGVLSAGERGTTFRCGTTGPPDATVARTVDAPGGIYLTSSGHLRVLVVFVSFPDDTTLHPYWPVHGPPLFMDEFVDPDTTVRSASPFNITNYFRQMSLGRFHVTGEALWVESPYSQEVYRNSGSFGAATMAVLPERVDTLVDFSLYDNWTRVADHVHLNQPDGIVDMILMVWRTTMWEYDGEASLGYKPALTMDGVRVEMGYPRSLEFPLGSGVTCEYHYGDDPVRVMRTMVHEMSHWLLGIFHPYNGLKPDGKFQYWGMLCNGERVASCANTYDRERLGWIVPQVPAPGSTITLRDFVTTGDAAKIPVPGGVPDEFYYIENHQLLSVLDDVTLEREDRGIWILHQQGPYLEVDNIRILPADGLWHWTAPATAACPGTAIPLYVRGDPDIAAGISHRDQIPIPASRVQWMLAHRARDGAHVCGKGFAGEGFHGAFDTLHTPVFSPWSNPPARTWTGGTAGWGFEITGKQDGVITIAIAADGVTDAPARRHLGRSSAGAAAGPLGLAWGNQWPAGQQVEDDVRWSVLERSVAGEPWVQVYAGPAFAWSDSAMLFDSAGVVPVAYRARVLDADGRPSAWSFLHHERAAGTVSVRSREDPAHREVAMQLSSHPNPFNPSTTITFDPGTAARVTLTVIDVLGRTVRTLTDGEVVPGPRSVPWDGRDRAGVPVAAGVYLCVLRSGQEILTHRMLLLR